MNFTQWMATATSTKRAAAPDVRLKIFNRTRQTVLAAWAQVADREATRRRGLLGRDSLDPGEALWIVPCEAVHTFGMKFPIDLVYIDRKQRVRKVRSAVPAWRMSICFTAHSVIELAAGAAKAAHTVCGDQLEFSPAKVNQ